MRRIICLLTLLFAVLIANPAGAREPAWAEGNSRGEDLHIYLVTFGTGDDIASWFGHTALMVSDERTRQQRVYNYGMFSFGPDMLPKFLMGRLEFWVDDESVPRTMALYKALNRDITLTELNLTPAKRKEIAEFLAWNIEPANRDYLYHHYMDNCATRVRDVIDQATGGELEKATSGPARLTFRGHTHRHTQRNPYIDVLLSLWMNDEIDQPLREWDEMFLPGELLKQVRELEFVNDEGKKVPLVLEERKIFDADRPDPEDDPFLLWPWTMLFGTGFGFLGLWFARRYETTGRAKWRRFLGSQHFFAGLFFGLPGLVAYLFHFSDHTVTFWNENMLLWSPLTFLALPLAFPVMRGRPWALRVMRVAWHAMAVGSILAVALKVLPMFDQNNGIAIAMLLPFNVLMALAMHRFSPPETRGPLEQVDEGVWAVGVDRRFLETKVGTRMTVIKLDDGTLWLHSPIAWDETLGNEIDALGPVRHIVGPNKFHHMHLGEWIGRYPDAKLYGAPGLAKKRGDLKFDVELGEDPPEAWDGQIEQHFVQGAPALNEIAFFHVPSKSLVVCDLAENFGTSDHLVTKIYLKTQGIENTFGLSKLLKVAFTNRAETRKSIERILAWDFQRIILCHGRILEDDAHATFAKSWDWLGHETTGSK